MEQTDLVPKRRFKEFQNTDTWEQRRFDAVFDPIPNNSLSRADLNYDDGKIKSVHYGDILIKYGAVTDCRRDVIPFITGAEVSDYQSQLLQNGDLLIADAAEDETVGKATEIAGIIDIPVVSGLHTIACRPKVKMQPNYLGYYMNSPSYHRQLLPLMQGIKVLSISRTNLAKTTICYPTSAQEQSQIGKLFADIDQLITLHQSKLEKTKALKSAYLSEMFPVEGECEPKRRFLGFTQAWEECKVGEIFKVTRGQVLAATETCGNKTAEMPYPVYSSQTKNNGLMGYYKDYLFDTAITWTTDGANAGTVNYRDGKFYSTNVNGVLLSNEGYANRAVSEALNLVAWKYVSRVGNPKLMNNVMSDIVVSLPVSIEEQIKISEFFESVDHLITLHQIKVEKLQNIKKAYLNEMFI
jgi:type I restriction enzyme S subunit